MSAKAKAVKSNRKKARKKAKKAAAKLEEESGAQPSAPPSTADDAPGDSVSEARSAAADLAEAEPPTGTSPGPPIGQPVTTGDADVDFGDEESSSPIVQHMSDDEEPDFPPLQEGEATIKASELDPGDEVVIVNVAGLGDTEFSNALLGQRGVVEQKGVRSTQVRLDAGALFWFGHNRIALLNGDAAGKLWENVSEKQGYGQKLEHPCEDDEPPKTSNFAAGCPPLLPRMKDENVVKNTAEGRFIKITLANPAGVHPGSMLTPLQAYDESSQREYNTLKVAGIVEHSLAWNWNDEHPEQAIGTQDSLRSIGLQAIAEITHRYDGRFTDVERLNVETLL
jgi:hypothetical protein